jgi:phosphopantetheine adenylyltransferase
MPAKLSTAAPMAAAATKRFEPWTNRTTRRALRTCAQPHANVRVDAFSDQFLIRYAQQIGAGFILRGTRTESDYEYERAMRHVNGDLDPAVTTFFLMPPRGHRGSQLQSG